MNLKAGTNSTKKTRMHETIKGWTESELPDEEFFSGTLVHGSFVVVKFSSVKLG